MNQNTKNFISAILFLVLIGAGFTLYMKRGASRGGPGTGGDAPELSLPVIGSTEMLAVQDFRGEKTVLLDFWATWCPPCREQMPIVQKLEDDPELSDSLQIISVNVDNAGPGREAKVARYLEQNKYTFSVVLDNGQGMNAYNVSHLPTLVLVSPDGKITFTDSGVHTEDKLRKLIKAAAK
ncbi:TlpA family protein disulfide reductase [Bradymonas sediminis]|uniref:Uncharacterized protein n=1 Tax=Bradymonas sediminis TaxID=1548548 RepID=A0A2Z4FLA7_9DELT|nr:TlpA disulfide reductase family protein [Bradymonas sediminis]AWV89600.1 hypothetical protein DN745_09720 [Bradymonas sediminis]TDP76665.1 thiol-disulfide isomerase/thioredoxin [Bradymonas sediminis]